jgi:hypothetical protein
MKRVPPSSAHGPERNPAREQFWRTAVQQFLASGQSVRQFCKTRQLSEPSFYGWRRTLAQRDVASSGSAPSYPAFLPVQVTAQRASRIEIVLEGGRRVRLSGPVDRAALEQVLMVLSLVRGRSC